MLWATWARPALRQIKDCGVTDPPRRLSPLRHAALYRHPELVCALHASGSRVLIVDVEKVRCWHAVTAGETSSA
jgi:hypothetical protein